MNNNVLNSFRRIYRDKKNMQSFSAYYHALCNWVKNNPKKLGSELIHRNRLDILISLDLDKYLVDSDTNELCLEKEENRIGKDFSNLDGLLMVLSNTLWDMVTIRSDACCSRCKYGDLRYIKINDQDGNGKIVLECNECGYAMNLDGSNLEEKIVNYMPATKAEVEGKVAHK